MKIVDANVLLYAVNQDSRHHEASQNWLDGALSGGDVVGFAWVALLAFLRLSTQPGIFPAPLSREDAIVQMTSWLGAPGAQQVSPARGHAAILSRLLDEAGAAGRLVNDAHLAALALEHHASIVSFGTDFARFPGLTWATPNQLLS